MALDNTYQPPVTYPIRPLTKGMIRNLPSNGMPEGSFLRLQNYRVHEYGLKKRGGYAPFNINSGTGETDTYNEKLTDIIYYWSSAATPEMLLLGKEHLMQLTANGRNTTKVYANASTPETEYVAPVVGVYDVDLYTVTIELTCTEEQNERMYPGSEVFFKDVSDSDTEVYLGKVLHSTYGTASTVLVIDVGITEPSPMPTTSDSFLARENLTTKANMSVTHAVLPAISAGETGSIVFADQGGNGLYQYISGVLQEYETESSVDGEATSTQYLDSAGIVAYFEDRLWVGNTVEQGTSFTQRIRWSDPVNFSRFQPGNYVDLPYGSGEIINIVPLGSLLVAYYTDAIYVGRRTNIAGRPYLFERLETGKMGLISQRAIVPWNDGHFFVGQDNIYSLTTTGALQPIGAPILEETLEYTKSQGLENFIEVEHDPETESIVFLFPDVVEEGIALDSVATKLWRLNYKTLGWSYDEVNFNDTTKNDPNFYYSGLLPTKFYMSGRTWEDWEASDAEGDESALWAWMPLMSSDPIVRAEVPATTITDPDTDIFDSSVTDSFWDALSWENLKAEVLLAKKLYLPIWRKAGNKEVIVEELDRENDSLGETDPIDQTETTYPIWTILESMDYDFGAPDQSKTVTRFSCKIFDNQMVELKDSVKVILAELQFQLYMSDRMGYRWKRPITFGFKRNYNEGFANFRATGSTFRYKLINGQEVPPYKLSEMTLRVVGRGLQVTN